MLIAENEQGIVCIDGKPIAEHYREHGLTPNRAVIMPRDCAYGERYACILGLIAIIGTGHWRETRRALDDIWNRNYKAMAAHVAGLPLQDLRTIESGWADWPRQSDYTREDSALYALGAKAWKQCWEALQSI